MYVLHYVMQYAHFFLRKKMQYAHKEWNMIFTLAFMNRVDNQPKRLNNSSMQHNEEHLGQLKVRPASSSKTRKNIADDRVVARRKMKKNTEGRGRVQGRRQIQGSHSVEERRRRTTHKCHKVGRKVAERVAQSFNHSKITKEVSRGWHKTN